ncbi:MAG: SGNH/GDSL hydrolase family protein [Bacteroidales bacterium]|nr:SGNH/GDSL hydrolase family protein [Bacteroidales bacterium]
MDKINKIGLLLFIALYSISLYAHLEIKEPVRFLALGDSYTIGQSVATEERWPNQLYARFNELGYSPGELTIIAKTGWRTDQLAAAIKTASLNNNYTLVSLLIGVNNFYQGGSLEQYKIEFEQLLKTAISLAGNNIQNVFVVSIPDYAFTPFGNGNSNISAGIDRFNAANKQITNLFNVQYINITPISRKGLEKPELVASDGLHPSAIQYQLWVDLMLEFFELNETNIATFENPEIRVWINNTASPMLVTQNEFMQTINSVKIYSISGNVVLESNALPLPVNALPRGIYFYKIVLEHQKVHTGLFVR